MVTTSTSIAQLLGTAATAYGVLAALAVLLQARQMLARRASCEVSGRFFASYAGGYAIWLLYGLSVGNVPLIVVDAVGLLCAGLTLAVALSLRGSLIHPTTWTSCNVIPVSEERSGLVPTGERPKPGEATVGRLRGS
jgi:MtN3 and saliva related transmembrane protein